MRIRGPEFHARLAKVFTREVLVTSSSTVLTVSDCYQTFNQFCQARGMALIERKFFKSLIAEVIREEFNLGLRHDLIGKNKRQQQGWKGLNARLDTLELTGCRN